MPGSRKAKAGIEQGPLRACRSACMRFGLMSVEPTSTLIGGSALIRQAGNRHWPGRQCCPSAIPVFRQPLGGGCSAGQDGSVSGVPLAHSGHLSAGHAWLCIVLAV